MVDGKMGVEMKKLGAVKKRILSELREYLRYWEFDRREIKRCLEEAERRLECYEDELKDWTVEDVERAELIGGAETDFTAVKIYKHKDEGLVLCYPDWRKSKLL